MILDQNGNLIAANIVENSDLSQFYPTATFSRTGTAYKSSGELVSDGLPRYENGKFSRFSKAISLNGSSSTYITVKYNQVLDIATNRFTIEAWIYPKEYKLAGIISRINETGVGSYGLWMRTNGALSCLIDDPSSTWTGTYSTNKLILNQWQHVAGVYDGSNILTYINGQLVASVAYSGTIAASSLDLMLGSITNSTNVLNGYIDEVRVWNIARSQTDIQSSMYKMLDGSETGLVGYWKMDEGLGNKVRDWTANCNDAVITGATWTDGPGWGIMVEEGTTNLVYNSDFDVLKATKERVFYDDFNRSCVGTFTRATDAYYLSNGSKVTSGNPRYENGRFQNLLGSACDFETTTGWVFDTSTDRTVPATYFRGVTTDDKWQGTQSAKLEISGTTLSTDAVRFYRYIQNGSGNGDKFNYISGKNYIWSAYIKIPTLSGGAKLEVYIGNVGTGGVVGSYIANVTTNGWVRISNVFSHISAINMYIVFQLSSIQAGGIGTVFIDAVQIEEQVGSSTTPTDWRLGGSGKAITVEEGTTNLLSANQSNVETDTTGFTAVGSAITKDSTKYYYGTSSLKVVTNGVITREGFEIANTAVVGLSYTYSLRVTGSGTVRIELTTNGTDRVSKDVTLDSTWQLVTLTLSSAVISGTLYLDVLTTSISAITFWVDTLQLEQKSYATSWIPGGTTRNNETLTIPTTGISVSAGTWEQWVYVNDLSKRQSQWPILCFIPASANNNYGIELSHQSGTTNWKLQIYNDSGTSSNVYVADSYTPNGWHLFSISWNSSSAKLYIDGILRGTINTPYLPSSFAANAMIGFNSYWSNTLHDAIRISNVVRTDTEILAYYNATNSLSQLDDKTVFLLNFDGDLDAESVVQAGWVNARNYGVDSFRIKGNKLYCGINQGNYYWDAQLSHGDTEWKDVDITTNITLKSVLGNGRFAGLIIRSGDVNNYLSVVLGTTSVSVMKRVSGIFSNVTSFAGTYAYGTEYIMRITIIGTTVTIYINGVQIGTFIVPNDVPTQGKIAFCNNYAEATFDNIEVKAAVPDGWSLTSGYGWSTVLGYGYSVLTSGYNGLYAWKRTVSGSFINGISQCDMATATSIVVTENTTYTFSFWAKANITSGRVSAVIQCLNAFNNHLGYVNSTIFADSNNMLNNWTRIVITFTTLAGTKKIFPRWVGSSIGSSPLVGWYAIDSVQIEQKSYVTSYHRNDSLITSSTRNAETLTIPIAGLTPQQGTWEQWVYVTDINKRQVSGKSNGLIYIPRADNSNPGILLWHKPNEAKWQLQTCNDANELAYITIDDSNIPNGWNLFTIVWSMQEVKLYMNGVLLCTIVNPKLPSSLGNNAYIGKYGSDYINATFGPLRFSNIVRSSSEILTSYQYGKPFVTDKYTICNYTFNSNLLSSEDVKMLLNNDTLYLRGTVIEE